MRFRLDEAEEESMAADDAAGLSSPNRNAWAVVANWKGVDWCLILSSTCPGLDTVGRLGVGDCVGGGPVSLGFIALRGHRAPELEPHVESSEPRGDERRWTYRDIPSGSLHKGISFLANRAKGGYGAGMERTLAVSVELGIVGRHNKVAGSGLWVRVQESKLGV